MGPGRSRLQSVSHLNAVRTEAHTPADLDREFGSMKKRRIEGFVLMVDAYFLNEMQRIVIASERMEPPWNIRLSRVRGGRRPHQLRPELPGLLQRRRTLRRQSAQRNKACRSSGRATCEDRTCDQSRIREGARPHDPAIAASARGRGDSVVEPRRSSRMAKPPTAVIRWRRIWTRQ